MTASGASAEPLISLEPAPSPGLSRAPAELVLVAGGKLLSLASMFACGILIARATGPAQYGLYAASLAVVMILDAVAGTPWDLAAVRFGSEHRGDPQRVSRYLGAAFRLKVLICVGLALAIAPAARWVTPRVLGPAARPALLWIALASAVALLSLRSTAAYLQISFRFSLYGAVDAIQGVLRLAMVASLAAWGRASAAEPYLAASGLAPALVFALFLCFVPQRYLRAALPSAADLRSLLRYVGATTLTVLVGTLSSKCDVLILASVRSEREAGMYAAALQITMLVTLLASYASIVIQPRIAALVRTGKIHRLLRLNLLVGLLGGGAAAGLAVWLSPRVVPILFGGRFAASVPILRVLALAMLLDVLQFPVLLPLVLQLYPRASLWAEVAISAAFLGAAWVAASQGAVWLAWVAVGVRAVKLVVYAAITRNNLRRDDAVLAV